MFGLGMPEMVVILIIAFVFFGPSKLPELGKGLGEAIKSFKRGIRDAESPSDHREIGKEESKG